MTRCWLRILWAGSLLFSVAPAIQAEEESEWEELAVVRLDSVFLIIFAACIWLAFARGIRPGFASRQNGHASVLNPRHKQKQEEGDRRKKDEYAHITPSCSEVP